MPDGSARVVSGEHGHHRGEPQLSQFVRLSGVVGREIDREPGRDRPSDEMPVLGGDRIITEDGLVDEGDRLLAGVGRDKLAQERAVDCRTLSGQIAGLGIAP